MRGDSYRIGFKTSIVILEHGDFVIGFVLTVELFNTADGRSGDKLPEGKTDPLIGISRTSRLAQF